MTAVATQLKKFTLRNHTITLNVSQEELFMPNQVTKLFSEAVQINPQDIVFDIGSGTGPLAIWAGKEPSSHVYAVEIVPEQYEVLTENIRFHSLEHKVTAYQGAFFQPIPPEIKADVIIGDVSGIAEGPARALGWYPPYIPTGGKDGTEVIIPLLEQAAHYLQPKGRLYFPIGGLSNHEKLRSKAESLYHLITKKSPHFPLNPEQLKSITENGVIPKEYSVRQKGSRWIWDGWIYEATPKKSH